MKQKTFFFMVVFCLFFLGFGDSPRKRSIIFTYIITVTEMPSGVRELQVWVPYPAENDMQEVLPLDLTSRWLRSVARDKVYGNKILFYSLTRPDTKSVRIVQQYKITRHEFLNNPSQNKAHKVTHTPQEAAPYLSKDGLTEPAPLIENLAQKITSGVKGTTLQARAAYDYILENFSYDKTLPGWGEGNVERFCLLKSGNCTDFHSFFISLAHAMGIPAKFVIGFPLPSDEEGAIPSYHCWAEFYDSAVGWVPVDVSEAWKDRAKKDYNFGAVDENRIEFSRGRGILLQPSAHTGGLNYFIYPYVEIDGRPFAKIETEFFYQNEDTEDAVDNYRKMSQAKRTEFVDAQCN